MNPPRVFVYGTLLPGERNAHVAQMGGVFRAQAATLAGVRLFHLWPEGYPGLVRGHADDTVRGALLTYDDAAWPAALPFLDALEGLDEVPPLYTRDLVRVRLDGGAEVDAWVYLYARAERLLAPGASHVPGGDWRTVPGRDRHGEDGR